MSGMGIKALTEWRTFWTLPIAAAIGYSVATLHTYSLSPFIAPLQAEFDWTRAQASLGVTVSGIITAFFGVPLGMLVDRFGPRIIALIGSVVMAGTVAFLSTATGTIANWIMLWAIVAIGTVGVHATVWTNAVASRFEVSRGFAFAVTLCGASVGQMVFPPLATWLIGEYGWRVAYMGTAGIWIVFVFAVLAVFFRGAQDQGPQLRSAGLDAAPSLPGLTLAEGVRTVAFYKLLLAAALFAFTALGVTVHFVPILTDSGADRSAAAGIAALIGLSSLIGRLSTGALLDLFPGHLVGAGAFLLPIVAASLLLFDGANPLSQTAAAVIFGFTVGAEVDVIAYLATRYFGLKKFGALFGAIVTALALGTAFGPLAAGAAFDHFGSYEPFLWLTVAFMATSCIAIVSLRHPPFAARH